MLQLQPLSEGLAFLKEPWIVVREEEGSKSDSFLRLLVVFSQDRNELVFEAATGIGQTWLGSRRFEELVGSPTGHTGLLSIEVCPCTHELVIAYLTLHALT